MMKWLLLALACVAFGPWGQTQMFVPSVPMQVPVQPYASGPVMSAQYVDAPLPAYVPEYAGEYVQAAPEGSAFDGMLGWAMLG